MAVRAGGLSQLPDAVWGLSRQYGLIRTLLRRSFSALVREVLVRLLANPVLLRAAMVFFCGLAAFFLGLYMIRRLRKNIAAEADVSDAASPSIDTLPLHLYNTVIQQLKQQKHELQVQSQAEQQRARTTENFSQTVLSNLSCGVLVFGSNGLVKTANPAAKSILGFASTTGMSAQDIFREAAAHPQSGVKGGSSDGIFDTIVR